MAAMLCPGQTVFAQQTEAETELTPAQIEAKIRELLTAEGVTLETASEAVLKSVAATLAGDNQASAASIVARVKALKPSISVIALATAVSAAAPEQACDIAIKVVQTTPGMSAADKKKLITNVSKAATRANNNTPPACLSAPGKKQELSQQGMTPPASHTLITPPPPPLKSTTEKEATQPKPYGG